MSESPHSDARREFPTTWNNDDPWDFGALEDTSSTDTSSTDTSSTETVGTDSFGTDSFGLMDDGLADTLQFDPYPLEPIEIEGLHIEALPSEGATMRWDVVGAFDPVGTGEVVEGSGHDLLATPSESIEAVPPSAVTAINTPSATSTTTPASSPSSAPATRPVPAAAETTQNRPPGPLARTSERFGPVPIPGRSPLFAACYQIAYRLIGDRDRSIEVATAAELAGAQSTTSHPDTAAVSTTVDEALALTTEPSLPVRHAQHRERLRRDLARHRAADRAAIAYRHLAFIGPAEVAERLGGDEDTVRRALATWCPEDAQPEGSVLLRSLDSWIGADAPAAATTVAFDPLTHLDDPGLW